MSANEINIPLSEILGPSAPREKRGPLEPKLAAPYSGPIEVGGEFVTTGGARLTVVADHRPDTVAYHRAGHGAAIYRATESRFRSIVTPA